MTVCMCGDHQEEEEEELEGSRTQSLQDPCTFAGSQRVQSPEPGLGHQEAARSSGSSAGRQAGSTGVGGRSSSSLLTLIPNAGRRVWADPFGCLLLGGPVQASEGERARAITHLHPEVRGNVRTGGEGKGEIPSSPNPRRAGDRRVEH